MIKDDPERTRRLADALRQNLRRRKAQARDLVSLDHGTPDAVTSDGSAEADVPVNPSAAPSLR